MNKINVLRGSVRLSGEVSASIGNKIISQGEAKLGIALAGSGSHTVKTAVTITDKVSNPSRHNALYVAYRGNIRGYGVWKQSYCSQVSGSIGEVKWQSGKWTSYKSKVSGALRCGTGSTADPVAKKAYHHC